MSVLLISTGFAALLYLVSGIAIMSAMKKGAEAKASSLLRWPVLLGLVLHGYAVGQEMFTAEAVHFGFGYAVSVMFFFAVVTLLIESWVHRIHALFGIILIAAAFGALFPVFFQGQVVPAADWTLAFRWHLVFALAAYSFMMIAFVQAVLMMLQNTRLRAKGLSANDDLLDSLPGLVVMERVFFRIVATGFFCLTLVLILGAVVTKELQAGLQHEKRERCRIFAGQGFADIGEHIVNAVFFDCALIRELGRKGDIAARQIEILLELPAEFVFDGELEYEV